MISRKTILDLASEAAHDNRPLHDLLLTVAGMLAPNGAVTGEPDEGTRWKDVSAVTGCYGKGLTLSRRATEVFPPRAAVKPKRKLAS